MKELSIEQKAEAYDKAIEGIQEILSSGQDSIKMSRLQLRLQGIFPELKESKNEKIRKKLISFVKNWDKGGIVSKYTSNANDIKQILAWLEKQGESVKQKMEE